MFNRKKEKPKQAKVRLEDEFDVTSSDIAKALHKNDNKITKEPVPEAKESVKKTTDFSGHKVFGASNEVSTIPNEPIQKLSPIEEDVQDEIAVEEPILIDEDSKEEVVLDESKLEISPIEEEVAHDIEPEEPKPIEETINVNDVPDEPSESPNDHYVWAFNEEYEAKLEKQKGKKGKKGKKSKKEIKTIPEKKSPKPTDKPITTEEEKVDLNSFFEASKASNKIKRRDRKKYSKKELKRRKRRTKQKRTSEDLKDQNKYKFRKKKYAKVEDFISYLNDHYLDIDDVAKDVLADENFFGWISKKSGIFDQSLHEFQEIKAKIEKKL